MNGSNKAVTIFGGILVSDNVKIWIMAGTLYVLCTLAFGYIIKSPTHYNAVDVAFLRSGITQEEFRKALKESSKEEIRKHIENMNNIKWPKITIGYIFNELFRGYRYPETIEEEVEQSRRAHG
jgi:hypothetical protein